MAVTVGYTKQQKLVISGLKCDCPCKHNAPTQDIYVGTGLIAHLPEYIKKRELGRKLVLVADKNTYRVAGRDAEAVLRKGGFDVTLCLLDRGSENVEADESAIGETLMTMKMDTEFFVSVGSGSITDTTRTVAALTERPFVCVGTAPSMDGYTSVVAPVLKRGVKMHVQAICPEVIVCDLDVLRTAPVEMFIAGVGDVLGKYIAKADWVLGSIVNGEDYCPTCGKIVVDAVDKLLANIDEIRERTEKGTRILIEALLLAGVTIMIIGNTRAVASVEHNIAHYWEMQKLARGEKPPKHGTCVGVATLLVWPYFEAFKALDPAAIDPEAAAKKLMPREERVKFMLEYYGERAGKDIMEENPGDFLTEKELARRAQTIKARFGEIRAELDLLRPYAEIEGAMKKLGSPLAPAEIGIGEDLVNKSLTCCKDYRTRYTLFKAVDEIGRSTLSPDLPLR